ncbi:MAG: hypothetical protein ACRDOK_24250, partial [Streptosporangiaceae bacterium]
QPREPDATSGSLACPDPGTGDPKIIYTAVDNTRCLTRGIGSEDRHLRRPGLAPPDWRAAAGLAIDLADGHRRQRVVSMAALGPGWLIAELLKFAGRKTSLPPWLLGGALAAVGVLWLRPAERRKNLGEQLMPMLQGIFTVFEAAVAQEQRGLAGLGEVILPATATPTLRQQVAIMLARQPEPVLPLDIQHLIAAHFPAAAPTLREIRGVLGHGSEFVRPERDRWQFGRLTAPWRP